MIFRKCEFFAEIMLFFNRQTKADSPIPCKTCLKMNFKIKGGGEK